jgi:hypothetical protein
VGRVKYGFAVAVRQSVKGIHWLRPLSGSGKTGRNGVGNGETEIQRS